MIVQFGILDWTVAASNLIWITGVAMVLFYVSLWDYMRREKGWKFRTIFFERSTKYGFLVGVALVLTGYAFSPSDWNAKKGTKGVFIDHAEYPLNPTQLATIGDNEAININEMEKIVKQPVENATCYPSDGRFIVMRWHGIVGTPFYRFAKGSYELNFEGMGTEAQGDGARIYVLFVVWRNGSVWLERMLDEIRLGKEPRPYSLRFEVKADEVGKIRIQFFNDAGDARGDRDAFVGGFRLKKVS
jgi:hypothetical protein